MLKLNRIAAAAVVLALVATGCGQRQSSFRTTSGRPTLRPITDSDIAKARDERPPKILPETHFAAGKLFDAQGVYDKAIEQYRKAIALNHNYGEAYHRLGLLYSRLGKRDDAVANLRRAIELSPKDAVARNNYGFELLLCGELLTAEAAFREAINLQPDFKRAYVNLGIAQSKLGRFDDALACFRSVLPEADAYYNLGLMYRGQKELVDARKTFEHVLMLDPGFAAARLQLAQMQTSADAGAKPVVGARTVAETSLESVPQTAPGDWQSSPAIIPPGILTGEPPVPSMPADAPKAKPNASSVSSGQAARLDALALIDQATDAGRDEARTSATSRAGEKRQPRVGEVVEAIDRDRELNNRRATARRDAAGKYSRSQEGSMRAAPATRTATRTINSPDPSRRPPVIGGTDSASSGLSPAVCFGSGDPSEILADNLSPSDQWLGVTPGETSLSGMGSDRPIPADVHPQGFDSPSESSSLNTSALLSELEERLSVLRNEIDCLDDVAPEASDESIAGEQRGGTSRARLTADLVEPATPGSQTPGSNPGKAIDQAVQPPKQSKKRAPKPNSPTTGRDTWRDDFRDLERVVAVTLKEIRGTMNDASRDDGRTTAQWGSLLAAP